MKDKILKRSVWALLTVFFAIVFAIVVVAGQIAQDHAGWVDAFFGVSRYKLVNDGDGISEQDTQYFQSDYAVKDAAGNLVLEERGGFLRQTFHKEAMRANSKDVAERVNEEGAVLLWNKDGALPLQKGASEHLRLQQPAVDTDGRRQRRVGYAERGDDAAAGAGEPRLCGQSKLAGGNGVDRRKLRAGPGRHGAVL